MSTTRRTIRTDYLARVEGEGAMYVRLDGREVVDVKLRIYEPPRFFEALLRGRHFTEPVDITARICGICPVAYQMTACQAIEAACGTEVSGQLAQLRCCSTAASGSRATPCTSTCCTPPTSWAFPTR
jgi:sulfhydrogenase subunit alpha